jgi:hypothetical protein
MKLLKIIGRADTIAFYHSTLSYGTVHGVKLPSLSEFLALALKESTPEDQVLDAKADKILEAEALRQFNERKAKNGRQ